MFSDPAMITGYGVAGAALMLALGGLRLLHRHEDHCSSRQDKVWLKFDELNEKLSDLREDLARIEGKIERKIDG